MKIFKNNSVFASLALSLTITFYVLLTWEVGVSLIVYLEKYLPISKFNTTWWQVILLISYGLFVGYLAEKFSVKRLLNFIIPFIIFWGVTCFVAAQFFSVNLFFMRVTLITFLMIFAVHLKKLWTILPAHRDPCLPGYLFCL